MQLTRTQGSPCRATVREPQGEKWVNVIFWKRGTDRHSRRIIYHNVATWESLWGMVMAPSRVPVVSKLTESSEGQLTAAMSS